jgi:hypothetical protein
MEENMRNHSHIRLASVAAAFCAGTLVAACSSDKTTSSGNGAMAVQLTDAPFPIDSLSSVDVFVVRVDARQASADSTSAAQGAADDSASMGGWTTLATPKAKVNLLAYQNGSTLPLGTAGMAAGSYAGFRLVIDPSQSSVTLKNGTVLSGTSTPGIMFPSGSRSGIKINLSSPITVIAKDTTTVLIDFRVDSSFVIRGSTIMQNGLLFKPVIQATMK